MGYRAILCEILYEIKGLRKEIQEMNVNLCEIKSSCKSEGCSDRCKWLESESPYERQKRLKELNKLFDEIGE